MAHISILKKSALTQDKRIDSEYFLPEYLELEKILSKIKTDLLSNVAKVSDGNHLTIAEDYVKQGIRYLRGQDLKGDFVDDGDPVFIPEKYFDNLKRSHMHENDVLVSIVGTIGNIAMVKNMEKSLTGNCKLAILRHENISPQYVYGFLLTKFGQFQIKRMIRGAVQKGLILPDLRSIKIPVPTPLIEKKITSIIDDIHQQHELSKSKLLQAENLLLKKIQYSEMDINKSITYSINIKKIQQVNRLDAEYFQPKYDQIISKILKLDGVKLESLASKIETRIIPDMTKLYKYIEIGDIDTSNGGINYNLRHGDELPVNARIHIHGGELLISKVRPTRGAIGVVPEDFKIDSICSSAFGVFKVDSPLREYLQIVLRSPVGKLQLEQPQKGTSYPVIEDVNIENILIPIIDKDTIKEISKLVKDGNARRINATCSINKIKEAIETMIIKNSTDAIKILQEIKINK